MSRRDRRAPTEEDIISANETTGAVPAAGAEDTPAPMLRGNPLPGRKKRR